MTKKRWLFHTLIALPIVLLIAKFFYSFLLFPDIPFGYDSGIYRFLFVRHAEGWPPFSTATMPEWAKAHAPGLFFFSSILLHAGVPADWLIGWMWNLVPVFLACVLAGVMYRKYGGLVAFFTLVAALVSLAQYEGFLLMYYKVFIALAWCSVALYAYERLSFFWVPLGMMTVATHQQIGLIFLAAVFCSIIIDAVHARRIPWKAVLQCAAVVVLAFAWYLPTYERSLGDLLPSFFQAITWETGVLAMVGLVLLVAAFSAFLHASLHAQLVGAGAIGAIILLFVPAVIDAPGLIHGLFTKADATPGTFLSVTEYVWKSLPLLLLGALGVFSSVKKERYTVWHCTLLISGLAVFSMFFFYRRFLLPFDFFLLPFAALGMAALWNAKYPFARTILAILLCIQTTVLLNRMRTIDPDVSPEWLQDFRQLHRHVPDDSSVIVMDNMAPWVLGFLPDAEVSGPGIFDSRPYEDWEKFLLGTDEDRKNFFDYYASGTYFYATEVFRAYYPPDVQSVLRHPCLQETGAFGLYRSSCGR